MSQALRVSWVKECWKERGSKCLRGLVSRGLLCWIGDDGREGRGGCRLGVVVVWVWVALCKLRAVLEL